jgi:glutathione S-transferase
MADVIMGTGLMWAKSLGWLNEHPVLLAYVARLSQRPALHRTRQ